MKKYNTQKKQQVFLFVFQDHQPIDKHKNNRYVKQGV